MKTIFNPLISVDKTVYYVSLYGVSILELISNKWYLRKTFLFSLLLYRVITRKLLGAYNKFIFKPIR